MAKYKFSEIAHNITLKKIPELGDEKTYIGLEHLNTGNLYISRYGSSVALKGEKLVMHKGDILFGRRNTYLRRVAIAPYDGIFSAHGMIFRPKTNIVCEKFFPFFIQSDYFMDKAIKISVGSLSPTINWSTLKELEFELPDLNKQRELAELLWAAEETKQKYMKLLQNTKEIIFAKFIELFGNIGEKRENCPYKPLSECCIINPSKTKEVADLECSFVAMPSLSDNGEIDASIIKTYSELCKGFTYFAENDVLFAKITPCMENGKGAVAKKLKNKIGFGTTELHVLRPIENVSNPYWLYIITMFNSFRKNAEMNMTGSGGQRRVPKTYFDDVKVSVPPIALQNDFAKFYLLNKQSQISIQKSIEDIKNVIKNIINENFNKEVSHV